MSYDLELEDEKHILYKMLAAYNCNGCSSALLMQYINNEIYQEMSDEDKFADNERDDRSYIDIRRSKGYTDELEKINRDDSGVALHIKLKEAAAKKLRIRITGFSQAEYWYVLSNKGYVMSYKNYNISKSGEFYKMSNKFTETEEWYLLSNKGQILSYKKFNFVKPDDLCNKNNNINNKKQLMLLNATKKIS